MQVLMKEIFRLVLFKILNMIIVVTVSNTCYKTVKCVIVPLESVANHQLLIPHT